VVCGERIGLVVVEDWRAGSPKKGSFGHGAVSATVARVVK
jgi:hypothetical protein